jgi:LmbE family N-acetylglucosaminyl deacetylase
MTDALSLGFNSKEEYAKKRYNEFCDALGSAGISMPSCIELGYSDQESSFYLVQMTNDLCDIFNVLRPDVIMTHSYEGGHPDHDSAAFAVHEALKRLNLGESKNRPVLLELSSYHSDNGRMSTFDFLPEKTCLKVVTRLSDDQRRLKKKMFDCFETQKNVLQYFPIETECFRNAPVYDFTRAPHEGKLYYEYYDWGVKGDQWRKLAKEAIEKLNLRE